MSFGSWISNTWSSLTSFIGFGGYTATDPRRKILNWSNRPVNATSNQLLTASLPMLRAYCRQLERNNPSARAGIEGLVANVVGTGIALEPDSGDPVIDGKMRAAWTEFCSDCAINGQHDIFYLQSQAFREVVTAGEFIWRLVTLPERASAGKIPLCVLPLEAEWLDDRVSTVGRPDENGVVWVAGVGIDAYGRPVAYRIRNPEVIGYMPETLPVDQIIHDFERRRSLQARGEPWLAPVIETLQQERDLVDAELKAAVNTASIALVITSEVHDNLDTDTEGTTTDPAETLRLGSVARMFPGEDVKSFGHTRPAQQIAPFRQMLRGDIAGALRVPQRFLDRDVSRANYSSMRADMLDTDKLLAPVREWFGHATVGRLYQAVLPYLAIKAGIKKPRANYRLVPDGQPYVDPSKDVAASIEAIASGLSTWEREIGRRGEDGKKLIEQLKTELKDPLLKEIFEANQPTQSGAAPQPDNTNAPAPEAKAEDKALRIIRDDKGRMVGVEAV